MTLVRSGRLGLVSERDVQRLERTIIDEINKEGLDLVPVSRLRRFQ